MPARPSAVSTATPGRSTRRGPLDRATVLATAVGLADREGLEAISMRRLAEERGVVPMALYKHVADKEDLLDGMVEQVIGEFASPAGASSSPTTWKDAVRDRAMAARAALAAHPWARRAIETRQDRTPAVLGHMELLTQAFLAAGFTPDLTHHVMHVLGNRIWGFSPELFTDGARAGTAPKERRRTWPDPDPADYPGILAIAADAQRRRPGAEGCDEDFEFVFALDLILDAVERLHAAGWTSDD